MTEDTKHFHERCPEQDLELWKHHASFGGEDKNRMVAITTWLLSFSAAIFWYIVTNLRLSDSGDTLRMILVSILGISISVFAAYISLLFGGYANQNWEKADKIASRRQWCDLLPDHPSTLTQNTKLTKKASRLKQWGIRIKWLAKLSTKKRIKWLAKISNIIGRRYAKPCYTSELAPVFLMFIFFSALSFLVHTIILFLAFFALVVFAICPMGRPISEVF